MSCAGVLTRQDKLCVGREIHNPIGSFDDLKTASERLGNASTNPTSKHYRTNVKKVMPLSSNKK